jgi:hypothetical protein
VFEGVEIGFVMEHQTMMSSTKVVADFPAWKMEALLLNVLASETLVSKECGPVVEELLHSLPH